MGALNIPALSMALGDLVDRHEALRTLIEAEEGVPYQRILAPGATWTVLEEETVMPAALADRMATFSGRVSIWGAIVHPGAAVQA